MTIIDVPVQAPTGPTIQTNTSRTLCRALEILERDGWHQHGFGWSGLPHCAVGAIVAARSEIYPEPHGYERGLAQWATLAEVQAVARHTSAMEAWGIVNWNDTPGRTFADVKAAFVAAIEAEEK